ncbi:MAG TPA: DMT family transporter [Polyangiaceae bacterium]|nr:DMT family transporter [Polyangiaceae bacterium]
MRLGIGLALASAVAFGATTPVIYRVGQGVSPLVTAGLLYAGAAILTLALRPVVARSGRALTIAKAPRLLVIALFGAVLAPTAMVFGLARVGALASSLLLNLEALFTVVLGLLVYREPLGRRMLAGAVAMIAGGVLLALDAGRIGGGASLVGILALVACTLSWATDNVLTRALREEDPADIVIWKGLLGAFATLGLATAMGEPWPSPSATVGLLACGATGYGASLRLYLLAQRRVGASRTGSVFAAGPFVGAVLSWLLGDKQPGTLALTAGCAFAAGAWLHLTERHAHAHVHEPLEHVHAHTHDDQHHFHVHDPPVTGEHTHAHSHEHLAHEHEHSLDVHHDHPHS